MVRPILRTVVIIVLCLANIQSAFGAFAVPQLEDRVREMKLDNGLQVVVVERHAAPVFFVLSTFRVGSCQEQPNRSGLSHFLEHMLFKGTETIGTSNYRKEKPIMDQIERIAAEMRDLQITIEPWRYELFDQYVAKLKSELPPEVREKVGGDEAGGLRVVLEQMPSDLEQLPEEWHATPWMLADQQHDYWKLYRKTIELRVRLIDLMKEQKQYVTESEPINTIYDVRGAKMLNAFTTPDQTTYMVGLPSNCLELWMFIESDRYQHPVFREFYAERNVILEELKDGENEPWSVLYEALNQTAFQAHPYGRPVIGWAGDVETTLRTDMEGHFKEYYAPNNCQIAIVGDVDTDVVFDLVKRYFSSWKASEVAEKVTVYEPEQNGERRVYAEFDAEPQIMIGYHVPVSPHPDSYALTMIDQVLSMGRTSRFYKSVFMEQGLTASAPYTFTSPADRYPNLFMIGAAPKAPHAVDEVETALLAELEKLKNEPVTEHELEMARNRFRVWQLERFRSNQWLAFSLAGSYVNQGDWHSITQDYERLMEVTPDDIQRVAKKYFTTRNRTVATLVKPENAETTVEAETGGDQ